MVQLLLLLLMLHVVLILAHFAAMEVAVSVNKTWLANSSEPILTSTTDLVFGFFEVKCSKRDGNNLCYLLAIQVKEEDSQVGIKGALYTPSTILWSPHRNAPLRNNYRLTFGLDGKLVLGESSGLVAWSSGNNIPATSLKLLDNGNLVLINNETIVWESFSSPTDTLLPTQKLHVGQRIVSVSSDTSYSEGRFYVEVEKHQVGLYDNMFSPPQLYGAWRSRNPTIEYMKYKQQKGNWTLAIYNSTDHVLHHTIIGNTSIPTSRTLSLHISNAGTLELHAGIMPICHEPRVFLRNRLAGNNCSVALCGKNGICKNARCTCPKDKAYEFIPHNRDNSKEGCDLKHRGKENQDFDFLELKAVDHMSNYLLTGSPSVSSDDCKSYCKQDRKCNGAFFNDNRSLCYTSEVLLLVDVANSALSNVRAYIKVPMSERHTERDQPQKFKIIFIVTASALIIILSTVVVIIVIMRRNSDNQLMKHSSNAPKQFRYFELYRATKGFGQKLGTGGFGIVYKGTLRDGTYVAVKRLESARQGQKQFEAEVKIIGSISHKNLVKLQGFGMSWRRQFYLVYEFMPNLSLDKWLFTEKAYVLDWIKRLNIAVDIARGLTYLHEGCQVVVLHRDIKPQNILLDASFRAKICDFGLAKLMDPEENSTVATKLGGTPGYMPPELLQSRVSEKSDVYSFGIVLLELVSAQKIVSAPSGMSVHSTLCSRAFRQGTWVGLVDESLVLGDQDLKQVNEVVQIGLECVQQSAPSRPTMAAVSKWLEECLCQK